MKKKIEITENKMLLFSLLVLIFLIVFSVFSITWWYGHEDERALPQELQATTLGEPIVVVRSTEKLNLKIKQVLNDDKNLYILFDYGVVQVYELDGDYEYSIAIYNNYLDSFKIALYNNQFYIRDSLFNTYAFSDGAFSRFWESSDFKASALNNDLSFEDESYEYQTDGRSVWRVNDNEKMYIIERSSWSILSDKFFLRAIITLIIIIGFAVIMQKNYKKRKNKQR